VVQNQRERILSAVADVTSAAGYGDMTVEDVIVTAGVSRRTFYDNFKNKEDAFLAAFDAVVVQLVETVRAAYEREETFVARIRAGIAAFLDFISREPAFARMCIVEAMAAGSEAIGRRNAAMAAFAAMIKENARELGTPIRPTELTAETIVGGIYEVAYVRIVAGEIGELPRLLPELLYSALIAYMGRDIAAAEARRVKESMGDWPA
jgi:AcrR family transcriptional regulator